MKWAKLLTNNGGNEMLKEIVCSGFGGQGVLTAGKILMYVAYKSDYKVTWFPTYGNEMRGGAANCNVIISDERVLSPYAEHPDVLLAMNEGALDRYEEALTPGADLFVNGTIIPEDRKIRDDVNILRKNFTEVAQEINNEKSANIVMLGYMVKKTDIFTKEQFQNYMCEYFESHGKGKFNRKNLEAFNAGYDI